MKYKVKVDGTEFDVEIKGESSSGAQRVFTVDVAGKEFEVGVTADAPAAPARKKPSFTVAAPKAAPVSAPSPSKGGNGDDDVDGVPVIAPMAGKVVAIKAAVGDAVKEGDTVAILEAMKMENSIVATATGKVAKIAVAVGDVMKKGDVVVVITPGG